MKRTSWAIFIVLFFAAAAWWFWPRTPAQAPPTGPTPSAGPQTTLPQLESSTSTVIEPTTPSPVPPQEFAERARTHWDAIVSEDLTVLGDDYISEAVLHWIGGNLVGEYNGKDAVMDVWQKFFDANEVRGYEFKNRFTDNRTVSADVIFIVFREGAISRIPVKYVIRFNDDKKIVEETWRVEPSLLEDL